MQKDKNYVRANFRVASHIKNAFKGVFRHLAMSISCIGAVSVTLILISVVLILALNINTITKNIEADLRIRANIDRISSIEDISRMENSINTINGVVKIEYHTKEEELNSLIAQNGEVFAQYASRNPLSDVFVVEVQEASQIKDVCEALKAIDGIEKVEYGGESIQTMIDVFTNVRKGSTFLVIALGFVALFLIVNMIKMSVSMRKDEISIMRFVGAGNFYIKAPFVLEGVIIGIFGAVLPILISVLGYIFIYDAFGGHLLSTMFVLKPPLPFLYKLSALLLASGVGVGMIGAFYAVNRYMRWKR